MRLACFGLLVVADDWGRRLLRDVTVRTLAEGEYEVCAEDGGEQAVEDDQEDAAEAVLPDDFAGDGVRVEVRSSHGVPPSCGRCATRGDIALKMGVSCVSVVRAGLVSADWMT